MKETIEIWIKLILSLSAFAVVLLESRSGRRYKSPEERSAFSTAALILVAVLSVSAYYNFGKFHGRTYIHYWENFHYNLNSKYFPELGYDGLYVASVVAQAESLPKGEGRLPAFLLDLRNNVRTPAKNLVPHMKEVRSRFNDKRWAQFLRDHNHFLSHNSLSYLDRIRTDHGYNATPAWTFTARLFNRFLPLNTLTLTFLSSLDLLLLLLMFFTIHRTYGFRVLCFSLIVFGLGYGGRFDWVGGAFLRQDWLVTAVIGVCLLKQERYGLSGMLLAYSAMMRLFPIAFFFGPAVLAVRSLLARRRSRWLPRFAAGFSLGLLLAFAAGGLAGRGINGWAEFARNINKHRRTWLNNNVGLQNVIIYDSGILTYTPRDPSIDDPWFPWQQKLNAAKHDRRYYIAFVSLIFLFVLAAAVWDQEPDQATLLGMVAIFVIFLLTNYYWLMLAAVPLKKSPPWVMLSLLALNIVLCLVHLFGPSYAAFRYGLMSWGLAVFFLIWMLPDALTTLRRHPSLSMQSVTSNT